MCVATCAFAAQGPYTMLPLHTLNTQLRVYPQAMAKCRGGHRLPPVRSRAGMERPASGSSRHQDGTGLRPTLSDCVSNKVRSSHTRCMSRKPFRVSFLSCRLPPQISGINTDSARGWGLTWHSAMHDGKASPSPPTLLTSVFLLFPPFLPFPGHMAGGQDRGRE